MDRTEQAVGEIVDPRDNKEFMATLKKLSKKTNLNRQLGDS